MFVVDVDDVIAFAVMLIFFLLILIVKYVSDGDVGGYGYADDVLAMLVMFFCYVSYTDASNTVVVYIDKGDFFF